MDYEGLNAGVKLMLQVNEPGALLFMGDGHARQGDAEVIGSAIETSLDVDFSVDLIKNKRVAWPPGEGKMIGDRVCLVHEFTCFRRLFEDQLSRGQCERLNRFVVTCEEFEVLGVGWTQAHPASVSHKPFGSPEVNRSRMNRRFHGIATPRRSTVAGGIVGRDSST